MWRYCVLYTHGGLYLDLDSDIVTPLDEWLDADVDSAVVGFTRHRFPHMHGAWTDALRSRQWNMSLQQLRERADAVAMSFALPPNAVAAPQ